MPGRMVRALLFMGMLAVFAADVSIGCGSRQYVYGPVQQKFASEDDFTIRVGDTPYLVPMSFYNSVVVGDVVRFNGKEWSIVKHAPTMIGPRTTTPTPPTPTY